MANTLRSSKTFNQLYIGGILLIPVVLGVLPANFFDTGESLCLSRQLFDMNCYGCGLTRAIQHMIHFEFQTAWDYNPRSFIVVPLFIILGIQEIRSSLKRIRISRMEEV